MCAWVTGIFVEVEGCDSQQGSGVETQSKHLTLALSDTEQFSVSEVRPSHCFQLHKQVIIL